MAYSDLIYSDGTINASALMQMAHRRARAERNACICRAAGLEGPAYRGHNEFNAEHAAKVSPEIIATLPDCWSYAALLSHALKHVWQYAQAMSEVARRRPAVAPVNLPLAA